MTDRDDGLQTGSLQPYQPPLPQPLHKPANWDSDYRDARSGLGCSTILFVGAVVWLARSASAPGEHQAGEIISFLAILFAIYFFLRCLYDGYRLHPEKFAGLPAKEEWDAAQEKIRMEQQEKEAAEKKQREQEWREEILGHRFVDVGRIEDRPYHVWLPGNPGQGKSSLMAFMAVMDILSGLPIDLPDPDPNEDALWIDLQNAPKRGVTVIDPAGGLAKNILRHVPVLRHHDVIYFTLREPIPFQFFSWNSEWEKRGLANDIIAVLNRFAARTASTVGKMMENVLYPLVWTLLDVKEDVSFLDIHHFLVDKPRRDEILARKNIDPDRRKFWEHFRFNPQEIDPVVRLFTPLLHDPVLKAVFECRAPRLNMNDVVLGKKIFIADFSGTSPKDPAVLILTSLMIIKIIRASFTQPERDEGKRTYHMLYLDEFPNYQITEDFEDMLTQARKFRLCLTLANQSFSQVDKQLWDALIAVRNIVFFNLNHEDAERFRGAGMLARSIEDVDMFKEFRWGKRPLNVPNEYFRFDREAIVPFDVLELTRLQAYQAVHRRKTEPTIRRVVTPDHKVFGPGIPENAEHFRMSTLKHFGPEACKPLQDGFNKGNAAQNLPATPKSTGDEIPPQKRPKNRSKAKGA